MIWKQRTSLLEYTISNESVRFIVMSGLRFITVASREGVKFPPHIIEWMFYIKLNFIGLERTYFRKQIYVAKVW